ncbi:hypothetical protein KCU83_g1118, partial [Aureobasidium melanogenum]
MLIAVYLSCLFYACLNILTHCLERSKLNIIKSLRTLAMEDLLRLATMQARAATDDTEHGTRCETEIEFPDLMPAMQTLEVDTENTTIAEGDEPAQKVIKAGRALRSSYSNVCKDATRKLKQLIRDTNIHVPKVYQQNKEDDLCGVWYAIASDKYYQTHETLVPCHSYEFRALVVTYLHLVGGTPSHYTTLKKPKHTPYQQFLDLLPDFLSFSRCEQTARLGYSTRSPTTGPWK